MCPYSCCGYFVSVRSVGGLFRFIRLRHSSSTMKERNSFTFAPVQRISVSVRFTVVVGEYDIQSLYVGFDIRTTSLPCRGNSRGSASAIVHPLGSLISFTFVPMHGKWDDPRECILAGIRSICTGEDPSMTRTKGGAGAACCTFWRKIYCIAGTRP